MASRISIGSTPTLSAAAVCDFSWGKVCRQASTVMVISSRVWSSSTPVSKTSPKTTGAGFPLAPDRCRAHPCRAVQTAAIRRLGMGLALRYFGVVFGGSHSEPLLAPHKHPSRFD
jgi:hypothetical protein